MTSYSRTDWRKFSKSRGGSQTQQTASHEAVVDAKPEHTGLRVAGPTSGTGKKPSPILSLGLLPPATHPEHKDAAAHCLSVLPAARTALEYAKEQGVCPTSLEQRGRIRAPAVATSRAEKLSITSYSQADSDAGLGSIYDPVAAFKPQYGIDPGLEPMGFYEKAAKAYAVADSGPPQVQGQNPPREWEMGECHDGNSQPTAPRQKHGFKNPAHCMSSPSLAPTPLTRLKLSSYLAEAVCSHGEALGLFPSELYEWQAECLEKDGGICGGLRKNLVVAAPTSSGKTLLAEILMLRAIGDDQQLLKQSRKALFVLPYVALCEEKAERLQKLIMPLSRYVKKAYGSQHSRQLWDPTTGIIVCTPENANSLVNRIIEDGKSIEDELCCLIVDELHLVGRGDRGTVLEMLLSKFAFLAKFANKSKINARVSDQWHSPTPATQCTPSDRFLQIVGLTATMPNIEEISRWLNAVPFSCDFRPVPLREYLKEANGEVKLKQPTRRMEGSNAMHLEFDLHPDRPGVLPADQEDPDHIGYLTCEAIAMKKSVMIFCATKRGCQMTAKWIVSYLRRHAAAMATTGGPLRIPLPSKETMDARKWYHCEISKGSYEYSQVLAEVISDGVCFHHGHMTPVDRRLVETAFRDGHVKVLCATSTLGTGVNLPIFRTIFKDAFQGIFAPSTFISQETYRQISGRAGRTGVDEWGESYLIVRKDSRNQRVPRTHLRELLVGAMCPVVSSVVVGGVLSRERCDRLLLELLATAQAQGYPMDKCTLNAVMESTLVWVAANNKRSEITAVVQSSMEWLATNFSQTKGDRRRFGVQDIDNSAMIQRIKVDGHEVIEVTQLGKAVVASNMAPQEALLYMKDLNVALNRGFVTGNHLHVLYMCVPLTCSQIIMTRSLYLNLLNQVSKADSVERQVHDILGLSQAFLTLASQTDTVRIKNAEDERQARICLRLYIAYMLYRMILGATTKAIVKEFGITSGKLLDSLKEDVERFGMQAASLCRSMGKEVIAGSLREFASEVRKTNNESFHWLLQCGIEKRDAVFLTHLGMATPEDIVGKGKDELVRLLHNAYAVEGQEVDTQRLQAKVDKLLKYVEKDLQERSRQIDGLAVPTSTMAQRPPTKVGAPQEDQGHAQILARKAANDHISRNAMTSGIGSTNDSARGASMTGVDWQQIFDTATSEDRMAIYMHASNLVDKRGRRTPGTEMPKGRKPQRPEKIPIGIGFSWQGADVYVPLKGQNYADDFIARLKEALSRRPSMAYIAMIGWHNQISVLEDLMNMELVQLINIKLGMWILEPDRYETHVTNKFKKPASSFGGKKRSRDEPRCNQLKIRQTHRTASFETEAHEYCREIINLLDSEGTRSHYPGLLVGAGDDMEPDSIHLKISRKALRCMELMLPILERTGLLRPLLETEMLVCRIIGAIEERGVGFRQTWLYDENRRLIEMQEKVSRRASIVLQADTGEWKAVDLASTRELATILYSRNYYNFPPPGINKVRQKFTSTSKDALLELKNKYPDNHFLPLISLHRSIADLLSTIVTLGRFKDGDGKLRTNFLQTSAGTGRIATDEPNLQCLQKRKVLEFEETVLDIALRKCIVAPTPGRAILSADFKHIEFRLMSHLAEDSGMQKIMRRVDCDPFKLLACEWKKDQFATPQDVTPEAREHSKMLCYALLYGMGENRLAAELKITPSEAAAKRRDFLDRFPAMAQWIDRQVRVCTEKKYVSTLNGRIRWMDNIQNELDVRALAEDQRAAVNSICQGSAADIMKRAMIGIERRLKNEFGDSPPCAMLLQIHDELLFEVDEHRMREAVLLIKEEMEGVGRGLTVPLKVSFKAGNSWGDIQELDEPYDYVIKGRT